MELPFYLDFPPCCQFDTFEGIEFVFEADPANDLTYANALIQVRRGAGLPVAMEFKVGDGSLIKDLPYKIIVPPQIITIPPAIYVLDLRVRFLDQRTLTIFTAKWPIKPVITRL